MIDSKNGLINLWLAFIAFTLSSAGSVLLHIVFAIAVYKTSQSVLLTSIFISLQWLPALIIILFRSDWDYGMHPKKRWITLDLLSCILTLPLLLFVEENNYLAFILILLLRGIFDQINRINKTVISNFIFPKEKVSQYASTMQTGYHLGIGLAAVIGVLISGYVDLQTVIILDALSFLISGIFISFAHVSKEQVFPKSAASLSLLHRAKDYMDTLKSSPKLLFCALLPPLSATFFQGTYSVLQPVYPIAGLGLDASAVSISFILASLAIVLGSSTFSFFNNKFNLFERHFDHVFKFIGVMSLIACLSYVASVSTSNPVLSGATFTLMIFAFEIVWMAGYAGIVHFSPKEKLGTVFGISFSLGCLLASLIAVLIGQALDVLSNNFQLVVFTVSSMFILIIFSLWKICRNANVTTSLNESNFVK